MIGNIFKKYFTNLQVVPRRILYILLFAVVIIGNIVIAVNPGMVELSQGFIINPIYYMFGLFQGIIILTVASKAIMKFEVLSDCIMFLGRKSMSIMLFHVLCFKIVNIILILIYERDWMYLASRPLIYDLPQMWSALYAVVGIAIPIAGDILIDKMKVSQHKSYRIKK